MEVPQELATIPEAERSRYETANELLRTLSFSDQGLIAPHLERVPLSKDQVLIRAGQRIEHVYFPEGGIIAYETAEPRTGGLELGLIGREGMVGCALLLETPVIPADAVVQIDGATAMRIKADVLLDLTKKSSSLLSHLLSNLYPYIRQIAQTGYARGHHDMTERLARLLLLCHDRADDDAIHLTHEFMARMVAGQRTTVTAILHVLEGEGLIRNKRGVVIVKNRKGLENRAGEAYRWPMPEAAAQVQAV